MQPSSVAEICTKFEEKPASCTLQTLHERILNSALAKPDPYCVLSGRNTIITWIHNAHKVFEIRLQVSVPHFPSSTSAKFWLLLKLFLNLYLQQQGLQFSPDDVIVCSAIWLGCKITKHNVDLWADLLDTAFIIYSVWRSLNTMLDTAFISYNVWRSLYTILGKQREVCTPLVFHTL